MKVYIVTHGEYSDYRIIGAFIDKDEAEKFRLEYGYDEVEEYDTLDHDIDKGIMFQVHYRSWLIDEYVIDRCTTPEKCDNNVFWKSAVSSFGGALFCTLYLRAKDSETALKIAHERMGAILAMGDALKDGWYTFPDYKKY